MEKKIKIDENNAYIIPQNGTGYPSYDRMWVIRGTVRDHVMDNETSVEQAHWLMQRITELETVRDAYYTLFDVDSSKAKKLIYDAYAPQMEKNTAFARATRRLLQHVEMRYVGRDWVPVLTIRGGAFIPNLLQLVGFDTTQTPVYEFIHLAVDPGVADDIKARNLVSDGDSMHRTINPKELLKATSMEEAHDAVYRLIAPSSEDWKPNWLVWSFFNWLGI